MSDPTPIRAPGAPPALEAFILAGGLGTRLRPAVGASQKVVTEVSGEPFVRLLLRQLAAAGVRRVVLGLGYQGEAVRAVLGERDGALTLVYSQESAPAGTGGALRLARPLLQAPWTLVLNGDSLVTTELAPFVAAVQARGAAVGVLLAEVPEVREYGQVRQGPGGEIVAFEEKGGHSGPGWVNAGVYCFSQAALAALPDAAVCSLEREVFPKLIGRGLLGVRCAGRLFDIGTPERLAIARASFDTMGMPAPETP